jgi:hypothetical protein
MITTP